MTIRLTISIITRVRLYHSKKSSKSVEVALRGAGLHVRGFRGFIIVIRGGCYRGRKLGIASISRDRVCRT